MFIIIILSIQEEKDMKYYAVRKGIRPGIYTTWTECQQQVNGYPNARFKKFNSKSEAEAFLAKEDDKPKFTPDHMPDVYAFVDGSYNPKTRVYGCGGFLMANGEEYVIQSAGNDPEMASMRNVAGELLGAKEAINMALSLELPELTIFYDYSGIEKWATNEWKAEKIGTREYRDLVKRVSSKLKLKFVYTPGHSGIEGNELADTLAKEAVRVGMKKKRKRKQIWGLISNYDVINDMEYPTLSTFSTQDAAHEQMDQEMQFVAKMHGLDMKSESILVEENGGYVAYSGIKYFWKIQRITT